MEADSEMKIGSKIKKLRKKKNLSQEELAKSIGVNPNHLSKLETGKYLPSIAVLKKITEILEVSADYLLSDSDEEAEEIKFEDEAFVEKIRVLNTLEGKDKEAILHIIDSILTKKKMQKLLQEV